VKASRTTFQRSGEKRRRRRAPMRRRIIRTAAAIPPARTGSSTAGTAGDIPGTWVKMLMTGG